MKYNFITGLSKRTLSIVAPKTIPGFVFCYVKNHPVEFCAVSKFGAKESFERDLCW